ncbi:MAG: prolyl oligopeptidase family serine peptidase [Akkermansiaceae bacterium]|nr:prolyl oligopeptidase family serine peptidase [Akkermansiaceae bacterium]NNM27881.1 prolyl oligopeptidase family serine peptidase [Akkermansiaceae bacterium]
MNATPLLLIPLLLASGLQARTWTSADGKTLQAGFVSATATEVTLKRDRDGREFTLALTKLSEDDRAFVAETLAEMADNPPAPAIEGEYAGLVTGDWELAEHGKLPYAFYGGASLDGSRKYPLVVSLHGKSDNNENGKQIGQARSFAKPGNYKERPCLILAPLCYQPHGGTGGGWDDDPGEETLDLVKDLVKKLPLVDPARVYVVGYSMGGFGTWHFLKEEPRLFAAGVPIAGGASGVGSLRSMPIWSFHGAKDQVVTPASARAAAEELKRSKVFKYTEFPDAGHGIVGQVMGDPLVHEWLFAQKRG